MSRRKRKRWRDCYPVHGSWVGFKRGVFDFFLLLLRSRDPKGAARWIIERCESDIPYIEKLAGYLTSFLAEQKQREKA